MVLLDGLPKLTLCNFSEEPNDKALRPAVAALRESELDLGPDSGTTVNARKYWGVVSCPADLREIKFVIRADSPALFLLMLLFPSPCLLEDKQRFC
jgi:hypothetical protein